MGGMVNANFLPASTGLALGSTAQRWAIYASTIDASGAVSLSGAVTFSGTVTLGGTLKSATLVSAGSGNNVTLVNYQKSASPITGNSADQTFYTYTVPAGLMASGKGIRITTVSRHSTGSASVAYKIAIGSATPSSIITGTTTAEVSSTVLFMNDPNSQTSNAISVNTVNANASTASLATSAVDTTASVVINATFNVANTDAVTPLLFMVELIQ